MTRKDISWLGLLAVLAGFIWLRDRSWITSSEEVLPILVAMPLFVWLGAPWHLREQPFALHGPTLAGGLMLLAAGVALNFTVLLALGWTVSLWSWLRERLPNGDSARLLRLLVLPFMAFPWVTLDGAAVGWWFRLSAAWTAQQAASVIGFTVTREGTHLLVQGLPISVNASCSGLKVLQSMLIAGTVLAYLQLGRNRWYWWSVPGLVAVAWLANTLRVLALTAAALSFGPEFASGWFHTWGGWFVLALMFAFCWSAFALLARGGAAETSATTST